MPCACMGVSQPESVGFKISTGPLLFAYSNGPLTTNRNTAPACSWMDLVCEKGRFPYKL